MTNRRRTTMNTDAPEPSEGLARRILLHIEAYERRMMRIKVAAFGAVFTGSLSVAIASFMNFGAQVSHSGFLSFFSLWFSDFSTAFANLPDMLSSMIESFPAIWAALLLGGTAFALWSMSKLVHELYYTRHAALS